MPELPEVETIKNSLKKILLNQKITSYKILADKLRINIPKDGLRNLEGATIISLRRLAKYLLLDLDCEQTLIIHLGMSGQIRVRQTEYTSSKHDYLIIGFETFSLSLNDARRFGLLDIRPTTSVQSVEYLKNLGPEPLSDNFSSEYLKSRLSSKTKNLKNFLLDQKNVSGIGNIYASEILFEAKISPHRICQDVSPDEIDLIVKSTKAVLERALNSGGSFLRDYFQPDGETGTFSNFHTAYGREGKPCLACSSSIVRIKQSNLSSYYCPRCQN